jgi:hypothetical protein
MQQQLMRGEINKFNLAFGDTPTGADWCIKALHPADPLTEVRGVPDMSSMPTVCMNYQSVLTIQPSAGSVTPWSFEASLLPHPIQFMVADVYDNVVPLGTYFELPNTQLAGANHADRYVGFRTLFQRWRLAYMSVTCHQDGPDLANQGTICVSQPPVSPVCVNAPATDAFVQAACPMTVGYDIEDKPNYATSQSMPNAYLSRSRDGAYVPLKLTETCQDWVSEADSVYSTTLNHAVGNNFEDWNIPSANPSQCWPFIGLIPRYTVGTTPYGRLTSPCLSGNFAHISGRNLSNQTSFTFYVRCGIEAQVSPSSGLAPQLKLSPPYDPRALATYFAIARELKDAYPASYNYLGRMWDTISPIAKSIFSSLGTGGVLGGIGRVGNAVVDAGDTVRSKRKAKRKKKKQAGTVVRVKPKRRM